MKIFRRELLHELFFCIVITIVWTIAGVNAPTQYNVTHYYVNTSHNSSYLKIAGMNGPLCKRSRLFGMNFIKNGSPEKHIVD